MVFAISFIKSGVSCRHLGFWFEVPFISGLTVLSNRGAAALPGVRERAGLFLSIFG
jgi:hypothetical protein